MNEREALEAEIGRLTTDIQAMTARMQGFWTIKPLLCRREALRARLLAILANEAA